MEVEKHLSSLLQTAASELDIESGTLVSNGVEECCCCLSAETLSDLHDFFDYSGSRTSEELDSLWDDLAEKQVSLGSIVEILSRTMLKGTMGGVKAVEIYLSLLTTPDCPIYSLYSPLAFEALARCVRNCCKSGSSPSSDVTPEITSQEGDRREKGRRKGKMARVRERFNASNDEQEDSQIQLSSQSSRAKKLSVLHVSSLLLQLERTLLVLHLRERQETLNLIVELLVSILHLSSDLNDEETGRAKKKGVISSSLTPISETIFRILELLLDSKHGEPLKNAITILREITPTILLTQTGGTSKINIRNSALHFVTNTLLKTGGSSVQEAVIALPRYICCKAPEKTDGRSLAIESVITLLGPLDTKSLGRFVEFVDRLSRSKARHRLIAVDVAVGLLGGFPDALRCPPSHTNSASNASPYEWTHTFNGTRRNSKHNDSTASQFRIDGPAGREDDWENARAEEEQSDMDVHQPEKSASRESQWWGITCIQVLLQRSSDKVPSIRARSLSNLAQAIELLSVDVSCRRDLQSLLGLNGNVPHGTRMANANSSVPHFSATNNTPILGGYTPSPEPSWDQLGATPLTPGAGHRDLWSLLQRRCLDEKAAVRKSVLVLMKKSTTLLGKAPEDEILHSMGVACSDAMISIRKSALAALSEVFRKFPGDLRVAREWLRSALPLAFDNETTLQDECLNFFEELVVDRVSLISTLKLPRSNMRNGISQTSPDTRQYDVDVERLLPAGTLNLLKEMSDGGSISSCVKRICLSMGRKNRLRPGLAFALQNLISAHSVPDGAWFLLSAVSAFLSKAIGWEFLRTQWQLVDGRHNGSSSNRESEREPESFSPISEDNSKWAKNRVHLLKTISNVAVELPPDAAADLALELLERLQAFDMHPAEVGAHIKALAILCKRKVIAPNQGDELVEVWVKQLLEKAGNIHQDSITPSSSGSAEGEEDALRIPTTQTLKMQLDQQALIRTNLDPKQVHSQVELSSKLETIIFTVGALALVCPQVKDERVVSLLQTLITTAQRLIGRTRGCEAQRRLIREMITPEVYVHLWVAFGKLCLADDALAKRCIPLFVQELGRTNAAAVRNNIMIVMTDFCVRYTALMDGYIHHLTKLLKDSCELVRRQTFVLLSRLLQRDYIKLRGLLFHRFLLMLVDDSAKNCQLAKIVFSSILKLKAPLLAYNSFVELIFVLNDCISQANSSVIMQVSESERSLFSLRGSTEDAVEKRMRIYKLLLQQMNPEHLLAVSAKLCAEVLAAAADGLLDLNDSPSQCVLQDALLLLASKELRIINPRASAGTNELEELDGTAAAAVAAVKGRIVTQLMKKNLVQNAVPILIELKRLLETKNSPLLGLLMDSMRQMLKDYKNETEEILAADKQLQKEILYDMQKHEAAKARGKVVEAIHVHVVGMQGATPGFGSSVATNIPSPTPEQMGKSTQDNNNRGEEENPCGNVRSGFGLLRSKNTSGNHAYIPPRPLVIPSMRKSALENFLSPSTDHGEGSTSRVTWQHRTPTMTRTNSVLPSRLSRFHTSVANQAHTPHSFPTQLRAFDSLSPLRASQEETCLASAVADVAATATVTAVLQQVARKSVTPLRVMSLPRLRASPSLRKEAPPISQMAAFSRDDQTPPRLHQCLPVEQSGMESVLRRQFFGSIDDPCG